MCCRQARDAAVVVPDGQEHQSSRALARMLIAITVLLVALDGTDHRAATLVS